jgi:hypothetical protein
MIEVVTLIPLYAVVRYTDATLVTKVVLVAVYLALWGLAQLSGWFYFGLLLYAAVVYFLFFGSSPGRRWRP